MTRTIKAKDILPGMTIRWGEGDVSHQCPLAGVERFNNDQDVQGHTPKGQVVLLHGDDDVLVVKEPTRPAEPTEFGALVPVGGLRAVRVTPESYKVGIWALESGSRAPLYKTWDELLEMGEVKLPGERPTDDTAPRTWARWEDIPEGVPVKHPGLRRPYRKIGGGRVEVQLTTGEWMGTTNRYLSELTGWAKVSPLEGPSTWQDWDDVPEFVPVRTPNLRCTYRRRANGDIQWHDPAAGWRAGFDDHKRNKHWTQVEEPHTPDPAQRNVGDAKPRIWNQWWWIPVGVEVTTTEREGKLYRRVKGGMEVRPMGKCWMRVQRANIPKDTTWTEYLR